jgi:branched-chain amino acid transport system ATP-binding protein
LKIIRILAIGASQDLEPLAGPDTCMLDLGRRTVLPGFIDAHEHLSWFAEEPLKLNVSSGQVNSLAELLKKVHGAAAKLAPGEWIQAVLYDDTKMAEGRRLTRDDLDPVAPENPVIVVHVSGHWAVVNSAALKAGGLTDRTPDPKGGTLGRDPETGRLDGRLIEMAMFNFAFESLAVQPTVVPPFPRDVRRKCLRDAARILNSAGVCGVGDALTAPSYVTTYHDLWSCGELSLRDVAGRYPQDDRTGRADFPEVHRHPDRAPHEGRHVDLRYHHGSQPGPDPGRGSAVRNSAQRGGPPRLSGRRQKRMGLRPPLLQLEDIHTFYGKSHIIQGVSFNVQAQECVALLGRNGAGKTTTLRSVIGLVPPRGGRIVFNGKPINGLKPHEISRRGIGYVPEDRQIFASLTVLENLTISIQPKRAAGPWNLDRVFAVLPSLADRRKNRGSQLSGGEQQMLSIARALMTNPEILLLDEPSEGLAPLIVEKLLEMIQSLKQGGLTIVLVEQDVEATRGVADRYCILQQGQLVYQGDHAEFWSRPELQEKFLGV